MSGLVSGRSTASPRVSLDVPRPETGTSSGSTATTVAAPIVAAPASRSSAGSYRELAAVRAHSPAHGRAASPAPSRSSRPASPVNAVYGYTAAAAAGTSTTPTRQRSSQPLYPGASPRLPQRSTERLHLPPAPAVEAPPPRLPPDPMLSYGAAALPEMHPSALDRTPSRSAPFPPSPPRPSAAPVLATPVAIPPPPLPALTANNAGPGAPIPGPKHTSAYYQDVLAGTPMGPARTTMAAAVQQMPAEICVECMMRDRDMIDVDVSTPGVWARESDIDFIDALRIEEAEDAAEDFAMVDRRLSMASSRGYGGNTTDESHGGPPSTRESSSGERGLRHGRSLRYRIGRGHLVSQPSLKLWTSMNPPASSHRWRTLQKYLREQDRLLRAERAANEAVETTHERDSAVYRERRQSTSSVSNKRGRASTALANGMTLERVDIERDEREARSRQRRQTGRRRMSTASQRLDPSSAAAPPSPLPSESAFRRQSSPMLDGPYGMSGARSSTDLRSLAFPRSPSPGRSSIAYSDRPRSSMFWPSGMRALGHRSASASVFSLAPSGSMIDMHLGLSQDKHLPALPSDAISRSRSDDEGKRAGDAASLASGKKRRRGISKLFGRLTLNGHGPANASLHPNDGQVLSAPALTAAFDDYFASDEPLAPPNPSYLAERRRLSSSVGSASAPPSPGPSSSQFDSTGRSISSPLPLALATLTPQSSFSRPLTVSSGGPLTVHDGYVGGEPLALTSSPVEHEGALKREKSLPALPDWAPDDATPYATVRQPPPPPRAPSLAPSDSELSRSQRRSVASKPSKRFLGGVFSRSKRSSPQTINVNGPADPHWYVPHAETLDTIVRDDFIALRYPSSTVASPS